MGISRIKIDNFFLIFINDELLNKTIVVKFEWLFFLIMQYRQITYHKEGRIQEICEARLLPFHARKFQVST